MKKVKRLLLIVLLVSIFVGPEAFASMNRSLIDSEDSIQMLLRSRGGHSSSRSSSRSSSHSSGSSSHSSFGSSKSRTMKASRMTNRQSSSRSNQRTKSTTLSNHSTSSTNKKDKGNDSYYYTPRYYGNFYGHSMMSNTILTPFFCLLIFLIFCFYVLFIGTETPSFYYQKNKRGEEKEIIFDTGIGYIGGFLIVAIFMIPFIDEIYIVFFDTNVFMALMVSGIIAMGIFIYLVCRQRLYFKHYYKYTLALKCKMSKGLVTFNLFDLEEVKAQSIKEWKQDFKLTVFLLVIIIIGIIESILNINYVALFFSTLLLGVLLYSLYYNHLFARFKNYCAIRSMSEVELKDYMKVHGSVERKRHKNQIYNLYYML